jgi:nucleotide-binding universal stress UspA family protein
VPADEALEYANRQRAEALVRSAVARATGAEPAVAAVPYAAQGSVRHVLYGAVECPDLLVVGHRERGTAATALLEGTAVDLARQSMEPVVVVKARETPGAGHVVVGLSHSLQAGAILAFAFGEADRRRRALAVVHVAANRRTDAWLDLDLGELHLTAADPNWQVLDALVRPLRRRYPRVPVTLALCQPPVVPGLLRAARGAELLVVGTTGHTRLDSALGGSVSRAMIVRAGCPVAVVPAAAAITLIPRRDMPVAAG